jgi:hypothetical protein
LNARRGTKTAAAAATLLLAACGGGSADDDSTGGRPDDAKRVAFIACLRTAGVQVDEQNGHGGIEVRVPDGMSKARMATIERNCDRKTGGGPRRGRDLSPSQKAEFLDRALRFARCMRAHGVPMSDPVADGHGIRMGVNGSQGDPDSPVFRRAAEACKSLNPKAGGGPKEPK